MKLVIFNVDFLYQILVHVLGFGYESFINFFFLYGCVYIWFWFRYEILYFYYMQLVIGYGARYWNYWEYLLYELIKINKYRCEDRFYE